MRHSILSLLIAIAVTLFLAGCNPAYITRLAYEQTKVITGREKISHVMLDPSYPIETKEKLALILEAREFGKSVGLNLNDNYTRYYDVGRPEFSWIVMAANKDSLTPKTWWFPIIGSVPYKGYFEKESAEKLAKDLEVSGLETYVRPTRAMSTLGWFSDPVLSTMLSMPITSVIETIFHEAFHATVWVPDNVSFNESAAEAFGATAAIEFFNLRYQICLNSGSSENCEKEKTLLEQARQTLSFQVYFSDEISKLHQSLSELYSSKISLEEKLSKRELLYNTAMKPFFEKFPQSTFPRTINNAAILQSYIYYVKTKEFASMYQSSGSPQNFLKQLKEISILPNPFQELTMRQKA